MASDPDQAAGSSPPDFRLAIEQYLEDILVAQWDSLDWGADLEYLGRQVPCGTLGRIESWPGTGQPAILWSLN